MRIAYAAQDRSIRVHDANAGGEDRVVSVPGLLCEWPLWSPDGGLIAFSARVAGSDRLGVYAAGVDEAGPGLLFANERGAGGIARGASHYCAWSPDGSRLGIVANTPGGLALFVREVDSPRPPRLALEGGPMYFSWSPDGEEMFVHSFTGHFIVSAHPDDDSEPRHFPGVSTLYMAPAWSKDSRRIAFFLDSERNRQRLIAIDQDSRAMRPLAEFGGIASVAWRPGHAQIALARNMIGSTGFYSGITVLDARGGEERRLANDPALAFYWSPDGSRMAYVTASEGAEGSLRIGVVSADGGESVYLPDFVPSQQQLTAFMFFDQYAQSLTPWSPDGGSLLIFGKLGYHEERSPLSDDESNRAIALDAADERQPIELAAGSIGCWGTTA